MATTRTTDLPDWLQDDFEEILDESKALSEREYEPYSGQRIAGFTDDQKKIMGEILGYDGQSGNIDAVLDGLFETDPVTGQRSLRKSDYSASNVGAKQFTDDGMMESYMNPYEDLVVDKFRRKAEEDMLNARQKNMASAIGRGAFGSTREAANTAIGDQSYLDRLANAEADLFYKGYGQAADIFSKDANRSQNADRFNAAFGLEADKLNSMTDLNNISAAESLGKTSQGLFSDEMALKGGVADASQQMNQANLDLAYDDFVKQQGYDYDQLGFRSDIVRGLKPSSPFGTITDATSKPSFLQQLAGTGINALGLYGQGTQGFTTGFSPSNLFKMG